MVFVVLIVNDLYVMGELGELGGLGEMGVMGILVDAGSARQSSQPSHYSQPSQSSHYSQFSHSSQSSHFPSSRPSSFLNLRKYSSPAVLRHTGNALHIPTSPRPRRIPRNHPRGSDTTK